ncbi:glycosyltransferase family 4 protein [Halomarina litorea]|uniref:glycosyltransferase family 4 protein n=1 Tax=Halomarina litorea TaxID=2961595 RepID=UPI0020C57897|nr:glycosyltransferase family 4 protein [Halomarina sp. BCD28]
MRVVQVTHRYPPRVGGVERHVSELATRLAARGHDVTVVAADRDRNDPRTETRDGVTVRRCRALAPGDAYYLAPGVPPAVRRLRREADVVHAHNYHALPLALAATAVEGTAFVATPHYHGQSASPVRDALLRPYRLVGRRALARADARIAVSEWERRRLRETFGLDATVVPNGLDTDRFADAPPEEHDRPYLLSVGRLESYKGVHHAIRALCSPDLAEYDLLVAGDGPYREELEYVAETVGVADRVSFLGYVDDDRLPGLYAGADALIALSTMGAYGMTVAEALAAGTPCVVRETGALAEWGRREDCATVDEPTPPVVARAVNRLRGVDAPAAPLPDWKSVVDDVLDVYSEATATDTTG